MLNARRAASRSHVMDLAEGHVAALKNIESCAEPYCDPINLGTGRGTSVLEMIKVRHPHHRWPWDRNLPA